MVKTVNDQDFSGKRALIRVDFNVPLDKNGEILDDTRIRKSLPTIRKVLKDGGSVVLISHLGRPKGSYVSKYSLLKIKPFIEKHLGQEVKWAEDCINSGAVDKAKNLEKGEVLLLENLRFYPEEINGDFEFSAKLAELGDVYVNDAFGAAHRAHASTAIVAKYFVDQKCFGQLMVNEIKSIEKVIQDDAKFTAVVGGAKVSDKVGILEKLMNKADNILIGGAMAYTFIKAKGGQIGHSKVEEEKMELAKNLMQEAIDKEVKLYLPVDSKISDEFSETGMQQVAMSDNIPDGWMGLDIGPEAIEEYKKVIGNSQNVLWNGPMGVFELAPFKEGSKAVAEAVAKATAKKAFTVVGGGDSVAAVNEFNVDDRISFISTGGGAMLEYLEGKQLPGVHAVQEISELAEY